MSSASTARKCRTGQRPHHDPDCLGLGDLETLDWVQGSRRSVTVLTLGALARRQPRCSHVIRSGGADRDARE